MQTVAARGPYARGLAKREEILDVALDLFSKKGYDRTSLREIARAVNLSQTGLLHHFTSKEELFVEVLRKRDDRARDVSVAANEASMSVERLIETVRHNELEPGLVRLYAVMSAESTAPGNQGHDYFVERYKLLRDEFAASVRSHQADGDLPADIDPDAIAALLIAAADGLQLQWLLDPSRDMAALLDYLWKVILRAR
jgi:AcrR family transcriptional regulator